MCDLSSNTFLKLQIYFINFIRDSVLFLVKIMISQIMFNVLNVLAMCST